MELYNVSIPQAVRAASTPDLLDLWQFQITANSSNQDNFACSV